MVQQPLLAAQRHALDQRFGRPRVQPAATMFRIDEGSQPHVRETSRPASRDIAQQVADNSLWKIVSFDFTVQGQLPESRTEAPVSSHDAAHQAGMRQVV